MKVFKWLSIGVVAVFLAAVTVPQFMSYALGTQQEQQPAQEQQEQERESVVYKDPTTGQKLQTVPMSLQIEENKNDRYGAFNVGSENATHCFEDVTNMRVGERSVSFDPEATKNPDGTDDSPLINWSMTATNSDGSPKEGAQPQSLVSPEENVAEAKSMVPCPGSYSLGNHAVRPVPDEQDAVGGPGIDGGITAQEYAELVRNNLDGGMTREEIKREELGEKAKGVLDELNKRNSQNPTANVQLVVHDVTPPDVWVAIRECVGDVADYDGEELQEKLDTAIIASQGSPCKVEATAASKVAVLNAVEDAVELSPDKTLKGLAEDYKFSFIAIDEGSLGRLELPGFDPDGKERPAKMLPPARERAEEVGIRNLPPAEKTTRLTFDGFVFDKYGRSLKREVKLSTGINEEESQHKRVALLDLTNVDDTNTVKGIYVRRNVPLQVFVSAVDNRDRDVNIGADENSKLVYHIVKVDGGNREIVWNSAELSAGAVFRVPNYPRDKYADQPEYRLVVEANDWPSASEVVGENKTVIEAPIFVMDTAASFDTMRR